LALAVAMLLWLFLVSRRRWQRGVVLAGAGILLVAVIVAVPWLAPAFLQLDTAGSSGSRMEVWSRSLAMIRDMPFTGIGLGAFPVILDTFYPSFLAGPDARIPHAHNLALQAAVDLGIPGALAFLGLFGAALTASWQTVRRAARRDFAWCGGLGLVTGLTVIATHGLLDATLWAARSMVLLWLLLALGSAWNRLRAVRQDGARC